MHRLFTRALERRGLYVGAIATRWAETLGPPPSAYFVLRLGRQPPENQMVRLEAGLAGRTVWADWGRGDH